MSHLIGHLTYFNITKEIIVIFTC